MSDQRIEPAKPASNDPDQHNLEAIRRLLSEPINGAPRGGEEPPDRPGVNPLFKSKMIDCRNCHPPKEELKFNLADFGSFSRDRDLLALRGNLIKDDPATREAREAERFKNEKPLDQTIHVFQRLPENISLTMNGKSGKLETDFSKVLESVPGVKLDDRTGMRFRLSNRSDLKAIK